MPWDKKTAELIAKPLQKRCQGREKAIYFDELIEKMATAKNPIVLNKEEVYDIIQFIRENNLIKEVIIETGRLIYVTSEEKDIEDYLLYIQERQKELYNISAAIQNQQMKNFGVVYDELLKS